MNLSLFNKLKGSEVANMLLKRNDHGTLDYFIISSTINYTVINFGECRGNINKPVISLNVNLSPLITLMEKQITFELEVIDGEANFVSVDKTKYKIRIKPSSIEYADSDTLNALTEFTQYMRQESLHSIDLSPLRRLSEIAAKCHSVVHVTRNFSAVELKDSFVIQKVQLQPMAIAGFLLRSLLIDGGTFNTFNNKLFYTSKDRRTVVKMTRYMPSLTIDETILTKGATKEKYIIDTLVVSKLISFLYSKYKNCSIDMANGKLTMLNEIGEEINCAFDIKESQTVALEKMKTDGIIRNIEMSRFKLPNSIYTTIGSFSGDIEVFIKTNKIIFKNKDMYLVFGR